MTNKNEKGFTLIELLIVIIILGILAAVVVFAVGGITDKGVNAACKADFKSVEVAQEAKVAQSGSYALGVEGTPTSSYLVPTWLKEAPSSTKYQISTSSSGVVLVHVPTIAADGTGGNATHCPAS